MPEEVEDNVGADVLSEDTDFQRWRQVHSPSTWLKKGEDGLVLVKGPRPGAVSKLQYTTIKFLWKATESLSLKWSINCLCGSYTYNKTLKQLKCIIIN
jgi:hypothetical protein